MKYPYHVLHNGVLYKPYEEIPEETVEDAVSEEIPEETVEDSPKRGRKA